MAVYDESKTDIKELVENMNKQEAIDKIKNKATIVTGKLYKIGRAHV